MTYRLNQIENALYAVATGASSTARALRAGGPTVTFRNQIKRLLEIDRANVRAFSSSPCAAFFEGMPAGSGSDAQYDAFGTFCLAVALEMLRFGFKQREIVSKIASMRPRLLDAFQQVQQSRSSEGAIRHTNDTVVKLPKTQIGRNQTHRLDATVFLVADPVEQSRHGELASDEGGIECSICQGWDDLVRHLKQVVPANRQSVFLVELSELVVRTTELLAKQPLRRRGSA